MPARNHDTAVAACLELVARQRHGVSFTELRAECERLGINTAGDEILWGATIPNVVLWAGMSAAFAAVCEAVYQHPDVALVAASQIFNDAGFLPAELPAMPRASWPPHRSGYRTPHILPVAFAWRAPLAGAPRRTPTARSVTRAGQR